MKDTIIIIEAVLEKIIFQKQEQHFVIGSFETDDEVFVGKGNIVNALEGKLYKLEGEFIDTAKFGEQFNFITATEIMPTEEDDIERLLASGIINGVGEKTARLIVEKFGEDTFEILELHPERLEEISGIGKKKSGEIHISFMEHMEFTTVSMELQKLGVESRYFVKLYEAFGIDASKILKENPYRLVDELHGISFNTIDKIAINLDFAENSPERIQAGLLDVLKTEMYNGHTFMYEQSLIEIVLEYLNVTSEEVGASINTLALLGRLKVDIIEGLSLVYLWTNYVAEKSISKKLVDIMNEKSNYINLDIDREIDSIEKVENLYLSEEQKIAVKTALEESFTIITGGPGTGKTTIINTILKVLERADLKVALAAPTGRAAKRMTESSGRPAFTLHRLLEYHSFGDDLEMGFGKNENNRLEEDVIIVDEASMIDLLLMKGFTDALQTKTKIIMVGDTDQLPPVGVGSILQDLIDSDCFCQVQLKEIFRQAKESQIIVSAHAINKGEMIAENRKDGDFFFMRENETDTYEKIISLAKTRIPSYLEDCKGSYDIQILSPMKKGRLGTHNLNKVLQEVWNPIDDMQAELVYGDKIFRVGDKVIQMKNNYEIEYTIFVESDFLLPKNGGELEGTGVFNGDIGYISNIDFESKRITVVFDGEKYVDYLGEAIGELELAYALTVHKSQGSEFRVVIMPIMGIPKMLATRNLLYTGITRGKELVILVGSRTLLEKMIGNKEDKERNSALDMRIKDMVYNGIWD